MSVKKNILLQDELRIQCLGIDKSL